MQFRDESAVDVALMHQDLDDREQRDASPSVESAWTIDRGVPSRNHVSGDRGMALDAARPEQKIPSNGAASNGELRQQPRRRRALIADEDPSVVCLLQRVLVDDFEVTVAANGQAAVDLVGTCQPDAIVLDLEMPVLDGFGACRTIRAAHPQIPIVIVSGRTDEDAVRLAFEAGATDYLAKPFTSSQLRARLQACLLRCS